MNPTDTFPLCDGTAHPVIGFGTYKVGIIPSLATGQNGVRGVTGGDVKAIVEAAVEVGYPMLDCAAFYENETEIGEGVAAACGGEGKAPYLCDKIWSKVVCQDAAAIEAECRRMLAELQVAQLDLLLVHWPVPKYHVTAYLALQELKKKGLVKSIGISNYTVEDYQELMAAPGVTEKPVVNQLEVHALLYRKKTIEFFKKEGVLIQAYRPLGAGKSIKHPTVGEVAARLGKTPGQVLIRFLLQHGIAPLPKSENPSRIAENFDVFNFELSSEDMATLDNLTTPDALKASVATYRKNVVRDSPFEGTTEGVKAEVTED
eukprot:TRINITY_DN13365_c0_g1_i1.p1 TRINITY_DN13365_c0_g1~~TRINITY_DN13365_c0_g1_i1.p1  ORF type:complete len:317 (+),score=127.49 TRINITY_DN13365_c0_g1_i1:57-1007(+)